MRNVWTYFRPTALCSEMSHSPLPATDCTLSLRLGPPQSSDPQSSVPNQKSSSLLSSPPSFSSVLTAPLCAPPNTPLVLTDATARDAAPALQCGSAAFLRLSGPARLFLAVPAASSAGAVCLQKALFTLAERALARCLLVYLVPSGGGIVHSDGDRPARCTVLVVI